MTYTATQTARIERLADLIDASPIAQAVVDYAGKRDADGLIRNGSPRQFGTRDLRHVELYGLTVVRLNPAAAAIAA
jgi:hypothetical protein